MNSKNILQVLLIVFVLTGSIFGTTAYKKLDEKIDKLETYNKYNLQRSDTIMTLSTDVEKLKKDSTLYHHHLISLDGQINIITKDFRK